MVGCTIGERLGMEKIKKMEDVAETARQEKRKPKT